jgi:O-antigen ligase
LAAGAAAALFTAVIVSAQGRGAIIACSLSVTVFGIWALVRGSTDRMVALVATGAGLGGVLGMTVYLALHSRNARYAARVLVLTSAPTSDPHYVGRLQGWRVGLAQALSHPGGLGIYGAPYRETSTWQVHNLWLFCALSIGWLGLAGLVLVLVRFGRVFIAGSRSVDRDGASLALLGLVLLGNVVIMGMVEPLVWEPYTAVMVWMPLWIAFAGVVRCNARLSTFVHPPRARIAGRAGSNSART